MNYKLRKKSREAAYKLIFEALFSDFLPNKTSLDNIILSEGLQEDKDYIEIVYFGVLEKHKELMEIISKFAIGFKIERIYKADLAALFLAIYEMKYMDDIPLNVSIAEAVELVKRYSTEKSSRYVNGILSSVFKEINNSE
ncbi:MAG TPA: transcription antitermination factor NusB [Clostridiales bacterium]|nr:transcription antitermination factor NusB [Clostridiales bacterium]